MPNRFLHKTPENPPHCHVPLILSSLADFTFRYCYARADARCRVLARAEQGRQVKNKGTAPRNYAIKMQ
jgi:hypothetical protein